MFKKVALAVAAALAAQGASAAAIDFHGYVREGVGSTSKGGEQVCFKAPYQQSKSRFGNECDNYSELVLETRVYKGTDGAIFKYTVNFASQHTNEQDYQAANLASRESYISGTGVLPGVLKSGEIWVGKRFYQRHDIHQTDEFYIGNTGMGWGIQGLDVGFGKLSYAYLRNGKDPAPVSRHDIRLGGLSVAKDMSLEVGLLTKNGLPVKDSAQDGKEQLEYTVFGELTVSNFYGGFNKTYVAFNKGATASWSGVNSYDGGGYDNPKNGDGTDPDDRKILVVLNHGKVNLSSDLELGYVGKINKWTDHQNDAMSLQIGVRPYIALSENTGLMFDASLDKVLSVKDGVTEAQGKGSQLLKLTGAYTVQAGKGWWARPQVRFFGTYASWNDAAKAWGTPGDGRFGKDNNGFTYGVQVEAWW